MKHLPLGVHTFEDIVHDNYLYVDKTAQLYDLFAPGKAVYFLSRPRRFGKSLMLSTLQAIFEGKRELFQGLAVYDLPYYWKPYPVIKINMANLDNSSVATLKISLMEMVDSFALDFTITLTRSSIAERFLELVTLLAKKEKVVLLIDEYDKPILDNVEHPEKCQQILQLMKSFYGVIKAADAYLRFAMLTGVSKFSRVSIFSDLNNLYDLTMDANYADMLGYSQRELVHYFSEPINEIATIEELSKVATLEKIKKWYNGYRFSEEDITVYNPVSVMNLFKTLKFKNYWFETGTPTFLINLLKNENYNLENINNAWVNERAFSSYEVDRLQLLPLLFQTGYLTIVAYNKQRRTYLINYPNFEVEEAFSECILENMSVITSGLVESYIYNLIDALNDNKLDSFFDALSIFFADIPYSIQLKNEKYYQTIFYVLFKLLGLKLKVEVTTNNGRIDVVINTNKYIYILEFKLYADAEIALQQIKDKCYWEKYQSCKKQIIMIGVGFDAETRNIATWRSEKI